MTRAALLAMALLMAGTSAAAAQEAGSAAASIPTCTELGVTRVAMTIPPGRSRDEVRAELATSSAFPAGTQVVLLEPYQMPRITDPERFGARAEVLLNAFLRQEISIEGLGATLLEVDEEGRVTAAHPSTGNRGVDRQLDRFWRAVQFAPVVAGECRAKALLHVRMAFDTESLYHGERREMELRVTP